MAEYHWSITDEGTTGAVWGLIFDVADDGRSVTVSRDPAYTDLTNAQTSDISVLLLSRADPSSVNTGATWADLAQPVTFSWPNYGLEVDLRLNGRLSGVWGRSPGLPAGSPQGIVVTSVPAVTHIGRWEIGENGRLRPLAFDQTDWLVEEREDSAPDTTLRYTTLAAVKAMMKAPSGRASGGWQSGEFDERLTQAIRSAETQVDSHCGRRFDLAPASPSERVYRQRGVDHVDTDDFIGEPTVTVSERQLGSTEFYTQPAVTSFDDVFRGVWMPAGPMGVSPWYLRGDYESVYDYGPGRYTPSELPEVTVSARWGWDRVPDAVSYAVNLMVVRLFRRPDDAALGVIAVEAGGIYLPGFDSDVEAALAPFRVVEGAY